MYRKSPHFEIDKKVFFGTETLKKFKSTQI